MSHSDVVDDLPRIGVSRNAFKEWIAKHTKMQLGITYCELNAIARIKSRGQVNISHFRHIRVRTPDLASGALFTCQATDVRNSVVWIRVVVVDDISCIIRD